MRLIACLILAVAFFYFLEKPIKKHATLFYIATVIISVLSVLAPKKGLPFVVDYIVKNILARGTLAGALFILVMVASVCPAAKLRGMLLRNRGEMAIIAALLTLIHNISYGKYYFVALFTKISELDAPRIFAAVLSLVMIVLLLPLTITSFMVIRKKMNPKKWKSFIHISMIFSISIVKGHLNTLFDLAVYAIIYIIYLIFRAKKYKKQRILCIFLMVVICALYIPLAITGVKASKTQEENVSTNISLDTACKDGTCEGSATGYSGKTTVSVTVSGGKISEINIVNTGDDEEYMIDAKDVIPQIIEKQSLEVDAVSGATHSSKGIINAVRNALENAK